MDSPICDTVIRYKSEEIWVRNTIFDPYFLCHLFPLVLYLTYCVSLQKFVGYDINGVSTTEQPPTKKCKFNNLELEKQIEIQNNEFFAVYDKIEEFRKRGGDCWAILEANNQFIPESDADVRFKWAIKPIERLFFLIF